MKKVGILTINDYNNYGNRLQNYAVQEVMKSLGFSVETIVNNTKAKKTQNIRHKRKIISKFQTLMSMSGREIYSEISSQIFKSINKSKFEYYNTKRIEAFKNFTSLNIQESNYIISDINIPKDLSNSYDYFVTGSDQVWNPNYRYGSPIDFLTFASKGQRIAYAPSFGVSFIPNSYIENYKKWLSEMDNLSVREEAGAKIIKELTGRNAIVLVDPTLMLTKEKWLSVSKPATNKPKNQYLLTYFLGDISKEVKRRIRKIASDNKLEVVNLADIKDKNRYVSDPGEFIDYLNSASVILTDSFHGAVFSILLKKPFVIFDRLGKKPSMNSRIETLLSTFQLLSRKSENIKNSNEIFNIDFSHVDSILEFERKKTLNYLRSALSLKEESEL